MAGIGFKLQKLLTGDDYTSGLKALGFSALITAGPFLITIALIVFVNYFSRDALTGRGIAYLQSLITYCYAFSLVTVSFTYLVLTRYVADEYYRGHVTSFAASFFSAYTVNLAIWGPLVLLYFSGLSVGWGVKLMAVLLYMLAVGMWLSMIFLSAAQNYWPVSRSFILGLLVSLPATYFLGLQHGLQGYFAGFVTGQAVVFIGLLSALLKEFGYWEPRDHNWMAYLFQHKRLIGIGFFLNFGIWVDKLLFWISPHGVWLDPRLRYSPIYDSPIFISYLTILPAMVYFFLLVETDFFFKYKAYYGAIQEQEGLSVLEARREDIVDSLRVNLKRVFVIQGLITMMAILLAPWILEVARLSPMHLSVLRLAIYSAFLQAVMLLCLNVLFYFDHQKEALSVTAVFCVLNAVFTEMSLWLGIFAYGYGMGLAALVAGSLALYYMQNCIADLHFLTFTRQPFPEPVLVSDDEDEYETGEAAEDGAPETAAPARG